MYAQSRDQAEGVVRDLTSRHQVNAAAFPCDITDAAAVEGLVGAVTRRFCRLDILVNDAAYNKAIPFADLDGLTIEVWDKIMAVNLTGPMRLIKAVAPVMKAQGRGRIVNIASVAGLAPSGSSIAYAVSKAGLIHLTRCMAVALAPETLVNCVAPGLLEGTRATANLRPEQIERSAAGALLKKPADKEDCADMVVTICRTETMTGQTMVIDAGRWISPRQPPARRNAITFHISKRRGHGLCRHLRKPSRLRIVRTLTDRTRQILDRISRALSVKMHHAQQMQRIEMPGILLDQSQAAAFRLGIVARVVGARRCRHRYWQMTAEPSAGRVDAEPMTEPEAHPPRFLPDCAPRAGFGCFGAAARFGFAAGFATLPARRSAMVARVVICSGFMRSSITAGLPLSTARRNAGANSAVSLTTSPCPPNASMNLAKSGLVSAGAGDAAGIGALLVHADRAVHLVVEHQHDRRDAMMERGGDLLPGHQEAAVADQADHHAIRIRDLRADRGRHAVAHRAVGRADIALAVAEVDEARRPAGEIAGIGRDQRIAIEQQLRVRASRCRD